MMNLNTTLKLVLIGFVLSVAFLGFSSIVNGRVVTATPTPTPTHLKLIDKSFTQKNFKYTIPQIKGMKNEKIQLLANNNIKKKLSSLVDSPDPKSTMDGKSKIIFQNNRLLSFQYDGLYMWPQANHPGKINQAINIDLTTGKIYSLKDLFKSNINYKLELKKTIKNREKLYRFKTSETEDYNDFTYEDFIEDFDDVQFVMHSGYLHLYTMGIYAVGNLAGYKIPYNDIKNFIDTNGSLWKAFKNIY